MLEDFFPDYLANKSNIINDYIKNRVIRFFLNQLFALMSIIQSIMVCILFAGSYR